MNTRRLTLWIALIALCAACQPALSGEETAYGQPLAGAETVVIADLLADPDPYVGKTIRVEGEISDVCSHRGCWIAITDESGSSTVRFKVKDGVIEFPMACKGKQVVAEGVFTKIELTEEQAIARAKHHAEERGEEFDPSTVTGPETFYQIKGLGAVVR